MALYREHVGVALPLDGAVWCQFALNAGMTQENLNARVEILPLHETLRQGVKNVGNQFSYRYNCDERTVIAAVVRFHHRLWFTMEPFTIASGGPTQIAMSPTRAAGRPPISTVGQPGARIGPPTTSRATSRPLVLRQDADANVT